MPLTKAGDAITAIKIDISLQLEGQDFAEFLLGFPVAVVCNQPFATEIAL